MGIYQLNKFLQTNCRNAIKKVSLAELRNRCIAVDISIYLYKYAKENTVVEGIYKMISTMQYYDIEPIFIFDGKPPEEKYELLDSRRNKKREAELKYHALKTKMEKVGKSRYDIEKDKTLQNYKNIFIKITKKDIDNAKKLISIFGLRYYTAKNEADELCASMVINGLAWACLSEDMDLFVYGCPRILRYASFINETAIIYEHANIMKCLGIDTNTFKDLCILCGTDYNKGIDNIYKLFNKYKIYKKTHTEKSYDQWLYDTIYKNTDRINIGLIKQMFTVSDNIDEKIDITQSHSQRQDFNLVNLKKFLSSHDFIFV